MNSIRGDTLQRAVGINNAGQMLEQTVDDPQEDSQVRLRSLQEYICELLIENQQLRMSMMEQKAGRWEDRDGGDT